MPEERRSENIAPEEWDGQETPPWVVILAVILVSIPLALCCVLLLSL